METPRGDSINLPSQELTPEPPLPSEPPGMREIEVFIHSAQHLGDKIGPWTTIGLRTHAEVYMDAQKHIHVAKTEIDEEGDRNPGMRFCKSNMTKTCCLMII